MIDLTPLHGRSPDEQKFILAGLLQEAIAAPVVVVGGSLVQLYTMGAITSLDLDIIADRRKVATTLQEAGFVEGPLSMWRHPDHAPIVNLVGNDVDPPQETRGIEYEGRSFRILSAEDCLIDRLCGAVHWHHQVDWERSITLARVLRGELDLDRLRERARQERVHQALEEVLLAAGPPTPK